MKINECPNCGHIRLSRETMIKEILKAIGYPENRGKQSFNTAEINAIHSYLKKK